MIRQAFSQTCAALLVAAGMTITTTGVAAAECQQFYTDAMYASAYKSCQPLAEDGDSAASFVLSNLYARGLGGAPADVNQALQWLRVAAEAGYAPAAYNLAALYEGGEVVDQSLREAYSWYLRGAEAGHADSQLKTGVMLLKGDGVKADYQAAQSWLEKSSKAGNANAQVTLAILLATAGDTKALHWYQLAAEQNNAFAYYQMADVYAEGKLGESVDLERALRLAKQSLNLGRASSQDLVQRLERKLAEQDVAERAEQEQLAMLADNQAEPVTTATAPVDSPNTTSVNKVVTKSAKPAATETVKREAESRAVSVAQAPVSKPASVADIAANKRDRAWLMRQPEQNIVMQLAQITSEEAVGKYIKKYDLEGMVDYYRARTRAGQVYVLLYHKNYPTVGESKQIAARVLPEGVRKGVWYRRFTTLQAEFVAADN